MLRIAFIFVTLLPVLSRPAVTQDGTLIAEGDYAAKKRDGDKVLAHWKFWRLSTGEYEAIEASGALTQTFRFDAQFMPVGYSFRLDPHPRALTNPRVPTISPMGVSCEYKPRELRCESDYKGQHSAASTPAEAPYVFIPGELYTLDFTWFLTGVVHLVERNDSGDGVVNVYTMTDSETNHSAIALKADEPIHLAFTGQESEFIMGKTQEVRKYEGWGLPEFSVLRVTAEGLVALIGGKSAPTVGFAMSNYTELVSWESPFHPVRLVAPPSTH